MKTSIKNKDVFMTSVKEKGLNLYIPSSEEVPCINIENHWGIYIMTEEDNHYYSISGTAGELKCSDCGRKMDRNEYKWYIDGRLVCKTCYSNHYNENIIKQMQKDFQNFREERKT
jgi:formylmethanofuran dehydrogenase subunit E